MKVWKTGWQYEWSDENGRMKVRMSGWCSLLIYHPSFNININYY